jgi:Enoyl-(Acyl carrier protein) reductase
MAEQVRQDRRTIAPRQELEVDQRVLLPYGPRELPDRDVRGRAAETDLHDPGGAETHGQRWSGPGRQPLVDLGARKPRSGELLDGQGEAPGVHQDPRRRTGQVRDHCENCIAPGFIVSDMTRATAIRIGVAWDGYVQDRAKTIPVQRAGLVEDVANAVSFFVDERSSSVSGQVLYVAGGLSA